MVSMSPRASGPVSASVGPNRAMFSTVALTRGMNAFLASLSVKPSSPHTLCAPCCTIVIRLHAITAAAW